MSGTPRTTPGGLWAGVARVAGVVKSPVRGLAQKLFSSPNDADPPASMDGGEEETPVRDAADFEARVPATEAANDPADAAEDPPGDTESDDDDVPIAHLAGGGGTPRDLRAPSSSRFK